LKAIITLPLEGSGKRLEKETFSKNRDNRQAAMKALANMDYSRKEGMLNRLKNDPDKDISEGAKILLNKYKEIT